MKRILIVLLCLVCLCKANAQPNYDVEIDGLCYSLNLNESTAGLVHVQPSVSEVDVPSSIMVGGRSFIIDCIMLDIWYYNVNYDFSYINTIHIPNTVVELRLRFGSENNALFPTISSLTIPSSVELLTLKGIKGLTSITIPSTVKEVGWISYLPDLLDIIVEDDNSILKWPSEGSGAAGLFKGVNNNLNLVYLGRQLIKTGTSYPYYLFGNNYICPNKVIIGPNVHDLNGYNLYPQTVVIPNSVKKGVLGECADIEHAPKTVIFEDGMEQWECSSYYFNTQHSAYGSGGWRGVTEWYIGRPGVTIEGINVEKLTIGPLLKNEQVSEFFNSILDINFPCSIHGDSAFIKLYQVIPPVLNNAGAFFDNETYMNTPLYVPMGSKHLYEQANHWRNFFNIIEFDWEPLGCSIEIVNNNPEMGLVEGAGFYYLGDTITLSAKPNNGYNFLNWTENGEVVSNNETYSFIAENDRYLTAYFSEDKVYINATSNCLGCGILEGAGVYSVGETVVLKAIPNDGYVFLNWTENGIVSSERTYTFAAEHNRDLTANFSGTGFDENEEILNFSVFANGRIVRVVGLGQDTEIMVYNIQGQCVYKGCDTMITIPSSGLYVVVTGNKRKVIIVE